MYYLVNARIWVSTIPAACVRGVAGFWVLWPDFNIYARKLQKCRCRRSQFGSREREWRS